MGTEDLIKLVKILGYTTSTNDNEALNACRRANELMKSMNLTWEMLIQEKTIVVNEIISNESKTQIPTTFVNNKSQDVETELMLQVCMSKTNFSRISQTGRAFITSLNDFYIRTGKLTEKQKGALRKWYNNI